MRRALIPSLAAGLAPFALQPDSAASAPLRVEVTVVGQGAVRVLVSEGHVVPCESLENRPILNEWMAPGPPLVFSIAGDCACVEHTYGSFRDAQWSLPTQYRYAPRRGQTDRVIRVLVRTDRP